MNIMQYQRSSRKESSLLDTRVIPISVPRNGFSK